MYKGEGNETWPTVKYSKHLLAEASQNLTDPSACLGPRKERKCDEKGKKQHRKAVTLLLVSTLLHKNE